MVWFIKKSHKQKTSAEIYLISHIPKNTIDQPTFLISPYPDNNGHIINENIEDKYFLHNNHVLNNKIRITNLFF